MRYWLHQQNRVSGPFTLAELRDGRATPGATVMPEGGGAWLSLAQLGLAAPPPRPQYHHVAAWKFSVLWVTTLGLYTVWWCWRSWAWVRERDAQPIRPFWRGVLFKLWLYPLLADIARAAGRQPGFREAALFVAFLLLVVGAEFLPDPWWLAGLLGFVPLLPAVREIDRLNRAAGIRGPAYQRVRWYHGPVVAAGSLLLAGSVFFTLRGVPERLVTGPETPRWILRTLERNKILEPGEEVLFFYSADFIGVRDDGNLLTDRRVLMWTTDTDDGGFELQAARFEELEALVFTPSPDAATEALLEVHCRPRPGAVVEGRRFYLYLSSDNDAARRFLDELRRRAPHADFAESAEDDDAP